jgi:hypothetical protein
MRMRRYSLGDDEDDEYRAKLKKSRLEFKEA